MHDRLALLRVEAVEQLVRWGWTGRLGVGRVHTHVGPNLPPRGDESADRGIAWPGSSPRGRSFGATTQFWVHFSRQVFARARPLMAHSVRAQRAAPIFLRVPASGARGLAAFAEPRGPLPDSGLVSCVRPSTG
ncbi:Uncharacterised protein [Mycobacterium tuberculosis]|nr:Uncharacterised protein [Mycobacterium tuberculosis]